MEDARPVGHVRRIQKARYDTEHSRQLMEHIVRGTDKAGQYFFFFFTLSCYSLLLQVLLVTIMLSNNVPSNVLVLYI
jgi:hypothetical protein